MKSLFIKFFILILITTTGDLCARELPKEKEELSTKGQYVMRVMWFEYHFLVKCMPWQYCVKKLKDPKKTSFLCNADQLFKLFLYLLGPKYSTITATIQYIMHNHYLTEGIFGLQMNTAGSINWQTVTSFVLNAFPFFGFISNIPVQPNVWTAENFKINERFIRQTETTTTTTPKPKKPRPSNIFGLISVLLTETREDASRAFNEIGTLFNGQFANATTTKKPKTTTTSTTTTSSSSTSSESDEDNEITTTTEPFRITRDEFLGILRSNVQGIRNLFGKEFRVAIRDSNQNVREFGRDLGNALFPYFANRNNNSNNINT